MAGKTAPCPGCSRTVQAPASGSAVGSGKRNAALAPKDQTLPPSNSADETSSDDLPLPPPADYPFLSPPQGPDEIGRLGPYLIRKVLGTGAMGIVFEAQDLQLKRLVALKVMKPSLAAHADFHRRFLREAQLAAAIDHEHIVTIYQVGEDGGVPFLAMKLLQGEALEDRLRRGGGRLPLAEAMRIGREIAEGLAAAHAKGLVHRDIKPANIWLEQGRDRVKIVDFGLARGNGADAHFTQAGAVIGTPSYMAPEQANGEEVDSRCDLFSLGAILYRCCTGQLPFDGKDTLAVLSALATKTPLPPRKIEPRVSVALSSLILRLLAKDRDERIQTAREVVTMLEAIERGEAEEPEREQPASVAAPSAKPKKPSPAVQTPAIKKEEAKKPSKKVRPSGVRKKKRQESERDWGRVIFVASLVLLVLAVLVLLVALLRQSRKGRATAAEPPTALRVERT